MSDQIEVKCPDCLGMGRIIWDNVTIKWCSNCKGFGSIIKQDQQTKSPPVPKIEDYTITDVVSQLEELNITAAKIESLLNKILTKLPT